MSNAYNRIITHDGKFNDVQLLAIALFLIWRKGEPFVVDRVSVTDKYRGHSGFWLDEVDLASLFTPIKYDIAKQYLAVSLSRKYGESVSEAKISTYVEQFVQLMYDKFIKRHDEVPKKPLEDTILTVSDIVGFMNKPDVTSEEQDKAFHEALDLMKEWVHTYLAGIADMVTH